MEKSNIAVFFGGISSEYEVSLQSAAAVLESMDKKKYRAVPVGITKSGEWYFYGGDYGRINADKWEGKDCVPAVLSPDRRESGLVLSGGERVRIDAAFPVMHGIGGEDGTLQGLIELAGIPLCGCGTLASALCMDKDKAHRLVAAAGIAVPKSVTLDSGEIPDIDAIISVTGLPAFVKPLRAGSSMGVSAAADPAELERGIELAHHYDNRVIIEQAIRGTEGSSAAREVGCAILDGDKPVTGAIDEIDLRGDFFDYTEKYTLSTAAVRCLPSTDKLSEKIKKTALKIYKTLGCAGFARVDMFLRPNGEIVFNEVNTIPGFTEHSRYPSMMRAAGYSLERVVDMIIGQAVRA